MDNDATPEYIEPEKSIAISCTSSDELTKPMYMIDHTFAKQDGPPNLDEFEDVDTLVQEINWRFI